ncbi:leucine--tRNA ligase [bacterium (Candidatus Gribaldobacteria) CG08_land_8_20_14_0_20_39_15]|uniref:Leucine--tRNA ligase n=1 Tax=bacterium (Candidatus Gribaldobacteria) CG08_land_8_20_14_0_20_39_15 TaxID=2014273 RepID=A0A2M6XUN9_9BACT|nr:MAG: leucine--tRNA ligase [bacterium (Candidatus Gribaldobacteria) CG08_land_8_20_14_0_20_39_15]
MPEQQYNPEQIEPKWQKFWEEKKLFRAEDFSKKPKFFLLVEFPYPSGTGLHVGHCRSYTAMDIIARKRRMQGYNVLFPMGWDAFGLPSENYAIKTGIHPSITTKQSIETFKTQEKSLGLSFDWQREVNTTDPNYYKWTQWLFLKLFERGLAYKAKIPINWCLSCKIGLANEEVVDGKCERCGGEIEKREKDQWLIKITEYAQRLIDDLGLVDFPERVKIQQKEWIGKSEGWEIDFRIKNQELGIKVFTTRVDTIFGCTYLVVAPEHEIIKNQELGIKNYEEVEVYVEKAKKKSERDRLADVKDKTGVKIEGVMAINPANGQETPIFVADYVLASYGTGAIMAVPGHDRRDFQFAKKYNLPVVEVIRALEGAEQLPEEVARLPYEGEGVMVNSGEFNGLNSQEAREKIGQWLAEKGLAKKQVNYKLRDWVFSRQRYWGEPIPLVFCSECYKKLMGNPKSEILNPKQIQNYNSQNSKQEFNQGEILNPGWIAVPENDLPVELPNVEKYKPTETGESPLAKAEDWVNTKCPKCGGLAKRETDVMPNWAGSNWYFMRYCDPHNDKQFASPELLKYWMPVGWYNGGMEHTTLHLFYSRFVYKFLWDIGEVPKELGPEPYKKRTSHGMILAEGGVKMSKSKGNVINPDDVIKQYGADTLRLYEMFMGPFEQAIDWDTQGVKGAKRFLDRVFKVAQSVILNTNCHPEPVGEGSQKNETLRLTLQGDGCANLEKLLHRTIKKISEDIEAMKFNTAISALMILVNEMEKEEEITADIFEKFLLILAPFAPHLAEELYNGIKNQESRIKQGEEQSIFLQKWPGYDKSLIQDEKINLIVQINGKVRGALEVERDVEQDEILELVKKDQKISKWLENKQIKKVVFIKNKLINFVI